MEILFKLDRDEGIDINDPIGDLMIKNNQNILSVQSTYLDSWFDVLIDGCKSLQNQNQVTLEIVEEPEVIAFTPVLKGFKITYGKQKVFFQNINEFSQSLLTSAQDFLAQLKQENANFSSQPILMKIDDFIQESQQHFVNLINI